MSAGTSTERGPRGTPVRHAGRYEIHERIGEGAMGVVHAAFDPKLHRKLAVKFVTPRRDGPRARERLLHEAQALARVSHPNVVSVFDTGEVEGQVFIAMDFVAGVTMSAWLEHERRGWREIVAMFVQAGRGLAATHEAGLVHRDFKPENVLVDPAGVARVVDFGLVLGLEESMENDTLDSIEREERVERFEQQVRASEGGTLSDDTHTRAGAIAGTPAYMAPEQSQGQATDLRSDQFSFCVALFEGLYGHRPSAQTKTPRMTTGSLQALGRGRSEPPRRIHAAVLRGLSEAPEERWSSMTALLDELEGPRARISPWSVLALAAGVLAVALVVSQLENLYARWKPVTLSVSVVDATMVEPMTLVGSGPGERYAVSTVANKGKVEFRVELPISGRYYLYGLVWEPTLGGDRGDADSLFVYLDGGQEMLWHIGCENQIMPEHVSAGNWAWQPVLHMANSDSNCQIDPELSWELDAGPHEIVFRNREEAPSPELAVRLARIVVTNQVDWRP